MKTSGQPLPDHTFSLAWPEILKVAKKYSSKEAIVSPSARLTYQDMLSEVFQAQRGLEELGLRAGQRIVVLLGNDWPYLSLYWAALANGLIFVPLNTRLARPEIQAILEQTTPSAIFVETQLQTQIPDEWASRTHTLDMWQSNIKSQSSDYHAPYPVAPDDVAVILYTSGTTGQPKGVMLTHRNLMANTWTALGWARTTQEDRWLVMAPLFHAAGTCSVLATVWVGGVQLVLANFDAGRTLDLIEREHATSTLAVPTMLAAIADEQLERPRNVGSLRLLSHGASPIPTETLRRAAKAFPDAELLHLYGTTETSPIATTLAREERLLDTPLARSCGQAALGVRVEVAGLDGSTSPFGQAGEVRIRGDNVMAGYWQRPEETARALRDGWYYTGDIGYLDETSHLFLVDRAKDMIVTGGENVYSIEVENAIAGHPGVAQVAVIGIPSEKWGEAVLAIVVPEDGSELTEEGVKAWCRERIAGYKVPKSVELRTDPLPLSGAMKVLKRELRAAYWQGRERAVQ